MLKLSTDYIYILYISMRDYVAVCVQVDNDIIIIKRYLHK